MGDNWFHADPYEEMMDEQAEAFAQEEENRRWKDHHSRRLTVHFKDGDSETVLNADWTTVNLLDGTLSVAEAVRDNPREFHFPLDSVRYWII